MLLPISHYLRGHLLAFLIARNGVKRSLQEVLGEPAPPLAESLVIRGTRVRFTRVGRDYYGPRFARVGINLLQVRTLEQFREGAALSLAFTLEQAAGWMSRHRPHTDEYRLLMAILQGDQVSREKLERRLARRARLSLVQDAAPAKPDESNPGGS